MTGRRGPRVITLLLATMAIFCVLSGSALAARPKSEDGSPFTIEKLQRIANTDSPFTTGELTAAVGQTVDYEIVVRNNSDETLNFGELKDEDCTNISPVGETELEAGKSETFTCEHSLEESGEWENVAEIEGGAAPQEGGELQEGRELQESNEVIVQAEEPEFSVEKLQRIKGSDSGFTTGFLLGTAGQTVEYEIVVQNTGDVPVSLSPLQDAHCTNISPAGSVEIDVEASQSFTCEHTLAKAGERWTNEATAQSGEVVENSNKVEAEAQEEPEFTIEKAQRLEGTETAFTGDELTAKLGQTIEYQIVVSNTGKSELRFSPLSDPNCEGVSPSGDTELAPGDDEIFTCTHLLNVAGEWANVAEIEAEFGRTELPEAVHSQARPLARVGVIKKGTSNKVVTNVPAEANFEIEKLQEIQGSGAGFTKAALQGAASQTVDYEVIVRNTGNVPLKLSALADANCGGISPAGSTELAVGGSETFTCDRALTGPGSFANEATIEGAGKSKTSNQVIVTVPSAPQQPQQPQQAQQAVQAKCTLSESLVVLQGGSGAKKSPFTVHISALGIKQISFYLDGHKLKTLTASQAQKGQFNVRIDPAKLHYGAHKVTVTTVMSESVCPAIARSAVFVHPRPAVVKPKFTG